MPRIVNHDDRRAELAQAIWSLIRKQGLSGVTLRNLSEESGWSSGAIRHYLPNREAILNFGAEHLNRRIEEHLRSLPHSPDFRQSLLNFLEFMLPVDDEPRLWMEVWLAYVGEAVIEQSYADTQGLLYRNLNALFVQIFKDFAQAGWQLRHPPEQAANQLHALLDGLSIHVLMHRVTPEQAKTILQHTVDSLLLRP
ncbi:TetR/AcrR family transcriptional regulator [Deinococcus cellulosilyticus]|uniref:Transcriptional regulator n=1 Tax=Deinococcus cellulosilyticus (strain DSM 18568 / NBRC 106333 / KACC 11606 / 5516J-15) TaxID=1223518 RepID=A0A511N664_DEIC1|nr:TetR family transcriptional regulator C-terminal domain-containing protein [Deinococcus cellulosilyticus]GEM48362.1 transcriptional regulator [Deinococcus cellulosilyticus NBRC 106333 = KACC 11606]